VLNAVPDIATSTVATLDAAAVDASARGFGFDALAGPARCGVQVVALRHPTTGVWGERTAISAALLLPVGCPIGRPLVAYARGTETVRARTMADPADRETVALMAFFAAQGWPVVATDYLGYAQSPYPFHPYLHARTEATSVADAIRAAHALRRAPADAGPAQVLIAGYSQGGHAALAAQRAIEADPAAGIVVLGTGAMAGPYDLAFTFAEGTRVLPSLAGDPAGSLGERVLLRGAEALGSGLGWIAGRGTTEDLLGDQSVLGWAPRAPVLLCGGSRDLIVPFENTRRAAADFAARGASVAAVDVEAEPAFAPLLPPPGAAAAELSGLHAGAYPPMCLQVVRDRLFAASR
jgi:pimeloyl-ACP methyl ester carboxylesterase